MNHCNEFQAPSPERQAELKMAFGSSAEISREDLLKTAFSTSGKEILERAIDRDDRKRKTIVFDFDGVIHSYKSGWRGETVIPDEPVEGIAWTLGQLIKEYKIVVVSSRSATPLGRTAVESWLVSNGIPFDEVSATKPPAIVYIDDRAICFDGNSRGLIEKIHAFRTWQEASK